jgi:hypothetical protein
MPSISSITKQYAGGLRQQQKGGQGGSVLGFLGMGGENKDEPKNVTVDDPILSEPKKEADAAAGATEADTAAAEPSFMDNALSAIGLGKKSEDEASGESNAPEQPAPEPPAPTPEPTPAPAAQPAPAPAVEPAPAAGDNVSMMDKLKGAFGMGGEPAKDDAISDATSAESSDASSAESSDDEEEDNGVDFEKFAEEIQTLRNKYQQLKEENKQLKSAKKTEPVQADTSEFSKMIASFFAIKGSVAQLQLSLKKHADQNGFPVDGLGLDNESESESESESEPEPEPEPDMKEESSTPPPPNTSTEEIPEIPVNAQAPEVQVSPSEVPVSPSEVPVSPSEVSEVPVSQSEVQEVPVSQSEVQEVPVSQSEVSEVPVSPSEVSEVPVSPSEVSEVPVPEVPVPEAPAPEAPATSNSLFSGGKNHYVQNMKNNKTHRHHKRRNRHQTLRSVMK